MAQMSGRTPFLGLAGFPALDVFELVRSVVPILWRCRSRAGLVRDWGTDRGRRVVPQGAGSAGVDRPRVPDLYRLYDAISVSDWVLQGEVSSVATWCCLIV